jgi:ribosomal protein L32
MGAKIRQCSHCGRIFQSFGGQLCFDCNDEMEQSFIKVRDYIYINPEADVASITEDTGVNEKWVLYFLREKRLTLAAEDEALRCSQCGKPISRGRVCDDCILRFEQAVQSISVGRKTQPGPEEPQSRGRSAPRTGRLHLDVGNKQ